MSRIICTLPNASDFINGVVFMAHKMGVISEEIDQETADHFLLVPGFREYDEVKAEAVAATSSVTPIAAVDPDPGAPVVSTLDPVATIGIEEKADTTAPDAAAPSDTSNSKKVAAQIKK